MASHLRLEYNREYYSGQNFWEAGNKLFIYWNYQLDNSDHYLISIANYLHQAVRVQVPQATQLLLSPESIKPDSKQKISEVILPPYAGSDTPLSILLNSPVSAKFYVPKKRAFLKPFQGADLYYEILPEPPPETIPQAEYNSTGWGAIALD